MNQEITWNKQKFVIHWNEEYLIEFILNYVDKKAFLRLALLKIKFFQNNENVVLIKSQKKTYNRG